MKHIPLFIFFALISYYSSAQENFKWEKTDTISLDKKTIYSLTKLFISEKFKSANYVIQNDDKDAGIIVVKGACQKNTTFVLNDYTYSYSFTIIFRIKDNKYKITLDFVRNAGFFHTCHF